MLKEFWLGLIVTIAVPSIIFGWLFFSTDKKGKPQTPMLSSQNISLLKPRGISSSLSILEEYNFGAVEDIKNCFSEYKNKLEEYRVAIFDAQYALEDTFSSRTPSYSELFDIIEGAQSALDVDLNDPYCY